MQYRKSLNEESYIYNQLYEYVSENKENAYIYPTYSLQYRYINSANLSVLPKGKIENLFPIGSWMIYNKEYNEFLKNKGKPYLMDHSNLSYDTCMETYDCSSFVIHCLAHTGIKTIPNTRSSRFI